MSALARLDTWSPARQRLAAVSALVATLTGALCVVLGPPDHVVGAALYLVIAVAAVFQPWAITGQVIVGQLLVARLLLDPAGPGALPLLPAVAGIVATAELLAVVARMDTPLVIDKGDAFPRAGVSAAIAAGVFLAVVLASAVPGPRGFVAVVLASAACLVLGVRLGGDAQKDAAAPGGV